VTGVAKDLLAAGTLPREAFTEAVDCHRLGISSQVQLLAAFSEPQGPVLVRSQHGRRDRRLCSRSNVPVHVGRRTHANGNELQLHARYGQNDCAIALGRSNWLFAGSLRAGQRAANIMSLMQSAKLNGHDPYRYPKDVLERRPTQPAS
jgi:IS66 C-terminal element